MINFGKYTIGKVVRAVNPGPSTRRTEYGHIVGFGQNSTKTPDIPALEVKWETGRTCLIHPANVDLVE